MTREGSESAATGFAIRPLLTSCGFGLEKRADKSGLPCTICSKMGHEATSCFQVMGFLDCWLEKNRKQSNRDGGGIMNRRRRNRGSFVGKGGRGHGSSNMYELHHLHRLVQIAPSSAVDSRTWRQQRPSRRLLVEDLSSRILIGVSEVRNGLIILGLWHQPK
ncbi:hypothetical protein M9H77_09401 [Catharanthus roseus]|uniref:Uncharacterized protein n=1 Tax=Catharanthus roseus TaxID=4058 RepID=A0ACC0C0J6_CATRO|nr:hypothetical protein M9H77_09401 [Catharanthus roseus]